jgi:hypothetical protein
MKENIFMSLSLSFKVSKGTAVGLKTLDFVLEYLPG